MAAWWLAAKVLFIFGLMLGWRLAFLLFAVFATQHVVVFASLGVPVAAGLNLVLLLLTLSAWRYYFYR